MTYVLEFKPEVARKLEERAAREGVKPAEIVEELLTAESPEVEYFEMDEVRAMAEKLFDDYALAFEALAQEPKRNFSQSKPYSRFTNSTSSVLVARPAFVTRAHWNRL